MTRPIRSRIAVLALALAASCLVAACASPAGSTSPSPGGASHDPAPSGFPLLGTWTATITRDDLRAGGITDDGLLNENSGIFTWAFESDGTWRQVMVSLDGSPVMNPVFSGYYTVKGGVVTAFTEFPEQYKGERLDYAFGVSGDAATFDLLNPPDSIAPVITEAHPWTRARP